MNPVFTAIVNKIVSSPTLFSSLHLKSAAATHKTEAAYKGAFPSSCCTLKRHQTYVLREGRKVCDLSVVFHLFMMASLFEKTNIRVKKKTWLVYILRKKIKGTYVSFEGVG